MSQSIDAQLEGAGVQPEDVRLRVNAPEQSMVLTKRDWFSVEPGAVQRIGLREVTKVSLDKTGTLTVRTPTGVGLETGVRGFEMSELKSFLAGVKTAIEEVKTRSTTGIRPAPITLAPVVPATTPLPKDNLVEPKVANNDGLDNVVRSRSTVNLPPIPKADTNNLRASGVNWSAKTENVDELESALRHTGISESANAIEADPFARPAPVKSEIPFESIKTPSQIDNANKLGRDSGSAWTVPTPDPEPELEPALLATEIPLQATPNSFVPALANQQTVIRPDANAVLNVHQSAEIMMSRGNPLTKLAPFGRWLKLLSPLMGLVGVASAGLFLSGKLALLDKPDFMENLMSLSPLDVLTGLGILLASLVVSLMAWGMGEFFASMSDSR